MTHILAALGILAIVTTASLPTWTNILLVIGVAAASAVPESWSSRAIIRHLATVAPLALFAIEGARLLAGRSPLDTAIEFAAFLQILRLATRRGAAHDQQILVLALLHFVAGTILGGGISYGLCFLGFLVIAPGALVLSHLRREVEGNYRQGARDRTGLPVDVPRILRSRRVISRKFLAATCLLSLPMLAFTLVLFLIFPRVGLSLLLFAHPHAGRMIGFSDRVDLGEVGVLRDDPTVALRFQLRPPLDPSPSLFPLRLRGTAFDTYDGRAWSRSDHNQRPAPCSEGHAEGVFPLLREPDPLHDRVVSFDLEPIEPPVVFLPSRVVALQLRAPSPYVIADRAPLRCGTEEEIRYSNSDYRGLHYETYIASDNELFAKPLPARERANDLSLPVDLPARINELARAWTANALTADAKAHAIQDRLRTDYRYDLHSPSQGTPQPLDHFLFISKRGHCEFFSTTMAIMLRTIGIPSRNVTGFVGGTWNRFGHYYAVRQGEAHSWVEAYVESPIGPTWQTFDPTPTSAVQPTEPPAGYYYYARDFFEAISQRWNTYVIGYDLRKQLRLIEDVRRHYVSPLTGIGLEGGTFGSAVAPLARPLALAAIGAIAYVVWRRRRRAIRTPPPRSTRADEARQTAAAALYRAFEAALSTKGIARPAHVPPLTYAEILRSERHPLSACILHITRLYLETRFGGEEVTENVRNDFRRAILSVRTYRP